MDDQCENFADCRFNDVILVNTHAILTGTCFFEPPCAVAFSTEVGQTFNTIIAQGNKLFNPAFWGVIEATKIKNATHKTGRQILEAMCSVRELPDSSGLSIEEIKHRSISSVCKFTGHPPLTRRHTPNMKLFLPRAQALVKEGVWRYVDNGRGKFELVDISEDFGLIPSGAYTFSSKIKEDPANYELKKNELSTLATDIEELDKKCKTNPDYTSDHDYISKKHKLYIRGDALKHYIQGFETGELIPSKFLLQDRYRRGDTSEGILLDKMLEIAARNGTITPKSIVIVMACRNGIDEGTVDHIKNLIDADTSICNMGGSKSKHKNRKNKIKRTRKNSRNIRRRKTRKIKRRKYKK
jgi:hypothetical protein